MKKIILCFLILISSVGMVQTGECEKIYINKWPKGIIVYFFDKGIPKKQKTIIKHQMLAWEKKCPQILFLEAKYPKTKEQRRWKYKISVKDSFVSTSTLGYQKEPRCSLGAYTVFRAKYIIKHELGHCLGLMHEHQKPNRDRYIRIKWENIKACHWSNFVKKDNMLLRENKYPYDFNSIMHYGKKGLSKNGEDTIETYGKKVDDTKISKIDVAKIKEIYRKRK